MGLLCGRAGRLTAFFGAFWPGQCEGEPFYTRHDDACACVTPPSVCDSGIYKKTTCNSDGTGSICPGPPGVFKLP